MVYNVGQGRGGKPTHDGKTGRDDTDARLDRGPYEDACETVNRVEMSQKDQLDGADDGDSADAWETGMLSAQS